MDDFFNSFIQRVKNYDAPRVDYEFYHPPKGDNKKLYAAFVRTSILKLHNRDDKFDRIKITIVHDVPIEKDRYTIDDFPHMSQYFMKHLGGFVVSEVNVDQTLGVEFILYHFDKKQRFDVRFTCGTPIVGWMMYYGDDDE